MLTKLNDKWIDLSKKNRELRNKIYNNSLPQAEEYEINSQIAENIKLMNLYDDENIKKMINNQMLSFSINSGNDYIDIKNIKRDWDKTKTIVYNYNNMPFRLLGENEGTYLNQLENLNKLDNYKNILDLSNKLNLDNVYIHVNELFKLLKPQPQP